MAEAMTADLADRPTVVPSKTEDAPPPRPPAWALWASAALGAGLCVAAFAQLSHASGEALAMVRQLSPTVWVVFVLLYLVQPLADAVIFRRLWRLPVSAFRIVLSKVAINEILFGYTGELYFYIWARRRTRLAATAFAAVKDVNILSALTGNVLTLIMLGLAALALKGADLSRELGPVLWPGLALVAISFGVVLFSRKVFSLPRPELVFVAWVHAIRLLVSSALTLLLWRLALPDVAFGVWLTLLASRLLLARLPFVANKELVFANLLLLLFGAHSPAAVLLTSLAIAAVVAHLTVLAAAGAPDLVRLVRRRFAPA
jgi:hypothetical protein